MGRRLRRYEITALCGIALAVSGFGLYLYLDGTEVAYQGPMSGIGVAFLMILAFAATVAGVVLAVIAYIVGSMRNWPDTDPPD